MAMTVGSSITSVDFVNLKARVKAEMTRRNGNGSLTAYAGATYDYTTVPAAGVIIRTEHHNKIRDPQAAINPTGLPATQAIGGSVVAMNTLEAKQTLFEAQPRGAISGNDCASLCSGMCVTVCTTTCSGTCTSSCGSDGCTSCSGCSGDCWNSCGSDGCTNCSGCSGSCWSSCGSDGCTNTCSQYCTSCEGCTGCTGDCWNSCGDDGCSGSCSSTCGSNGCSNMCAIVCTGCTAQCGGSCSTACAPSCSDSCTAGNWA